MNQIALQLKAMLLSAVATLGLSACVSTYGDWKEVDATPTRLSNFGELSGATVTLRDGQSVFHGGALEFGDALCDEHVCVRKSDVVRIGYQERGVNLLMSAIAAPIVGAVTVVCAIDCRNKSHASGPRATSLQISRQWLDGLAIFDGRVLDSSQIIGGPIENACVQPGPAALDQTFATDADAFAWIIANRQRVHLDCLEDALRFMDGADEIAEKPEHLETWTQLAALVRIRAKWNISRCVSDPEMAEVGTNAAWRIVPSIIRFRIDERRGHAQALAAIDAALADRTVFAFEGDLKSKCRLGILPREQWPDIDAWVASHSPYLLPAATSAGP